MTKKEREEGEEEMKSIKKLVAIIIAVIMVFGLVPMAALAQTAGEKSTAGLSETVIEPVTQSADEQGEVSEEQEKAEVLPEAEPAKPVNESEAEENISGDETPAALSVVEQKALKQHAVSPTSSHENQVRVIVENTKFLKAQGSPWDGTLVDTWVNIDQNSTMMSSVVAALNTVGVTQEGAEQNYITKINGLAELMGGAASGWMGTVNDWFGNEGFGAFTVASGKLQSGDEIRILYTQDYGVDIGSVWDDNTKTVKELQASEGALSPSFSENTKTYKLIVPEGTKNVILTPTASNKNFQVRTSVGATEYKRTNAVPIADGTVITVTCGDPAWPTMNEAEDVPAEQYTITVQVGGEKENSVPVRKAGVPASITEQIALGTSYTLDIATIFEDADNDELTYRVSIDGAEGVAADANYTFTPTEEGTKTLVFTANDGKADSQDIYTVTLKVTTADANLAAAIKALEWYKLRPVCEKDTNVVDVMQSELESLGYGDIEVTLKSTEDEAYVSPLGEITYFFDLASYVNVKNLDVVFTFSLEGVAKDHTQRVIIGWDTIRAKEKIENEEAAALTWDVLRGENAEQNSVTKDLTLPLFVGATSYGNTISDIQWTSSNTAVLSIIENGYAWEHLASTGKVTKPETDTDVELEATFTFKKDSSCQVKKKFTVTVKGYSEEDIEQKKAEMLAELNQKYTDNLLKDFNTKEALDRLNVKDDIQLPVPSKIGLVNKEIVVTSSNADVMKINGYRANIVCPFEEDTQIDMIVTLTRGALSVEKRIPLTVKAIASDEEIDREIELMEAAKAAYFDGINQESNPSKNNITENLHAFREVNFAEDGSLVWTYNYADDKGTGIKPVAINPDDVMGESGYNLFKSSNSAIVRHENLLVTRPEQDTEITISSVLSSTKFEKYAVQYPENEKLQQLYRQPVSVTVIVKGTQSANTLPVLKEGIPAAISAETVLGAIYALDLSTIFEDADGDALTYRVSINGAEAIAAEKDYTFTAETQGTTTLVFQANDGKANSEDTYTVTLTVQGKPTSIAISGSDILKKRSEYDWYYYFIGSAPENKFTLTASALPEGASNAVKWSSDSVAKGISIDENSGEVTANYTVTNNANYTTFTATSVADNSVKAKFVVYVVSPMYEYSGNTGLSVTLPEKGGSTTSSDYLFMYPSIYNDYNNGFLSWEIEDTSIAKIVKNGSTAKIEGMKPGTTTITVTNTLLPTEKMTFTAEVKGVLVAPQDASASTMVKQGTSLQLSAVGSSAEETFTWTSSDESVATVDQTGKVTAIKEGGAYIYAESSAMNGLVAHKGGTLVNVIRAENAPYLTKLELTNYSTYQEWTNASDGFAPATLNYEFNAKNPSTTTMSFNLKPSFDSENYIATAIYAGKEYVYTESGATHNIPVEIGKNDFVLRLSSKVDEALYTDYTFKVTRPRNAVSTIKGMTISPDGRMLYTAAEYKYRNQAEGTMFRLNDAGELTTSTGVTATIKKYKAFLFDDLEKIALSASATDIGARLRISVDGGAFKELQNNGKTDFFSLNETNKETKIVVQSCSDKTYYQNQEDGMSDPFVKEDEYTLVIEKVAGTSVALSSVKIKDVTLSAGEFCTPAFSPDLAAFYAIVEASATSVDMTLEVEAGVKVYKGTSVSESNLLTSTEGGKYVYTVPVAGSSASQSFLVVGQVEDQTITKAYAFNFTKNKAVAGMPDKVMEYLVPGSQYTNIAAYGMFPELTLAGGMKSLGGFGGYITYKYDTPIKNDPKNKYGIDFVVYGNSFGGAGASEPGNVLVSQDGNTWYTLAGSEHFDDNAIWGYELTYAKGEAGESNWSDKEGNSGSNYKYPSSANYPLFPWNEANEQSMTLKGVLLTSDATDPYGSKSACYPDFGYADVTQNGVVGSGAGNPYLGTHAAKGDGFDLSWAVDEAGNPVQLDSISFIKVQTASNIYAGAIGEKSTEVEAVVRSVPETEEVGKSSLSSITVDGKQLKLEEGVSHYTAVYDGEFDIDVDASENANVYINNQRTTTRTFESAPREGIVRVIVQEDEKAPAIYYITLTNEAPNQIPNRKAGVNESETAKILLGKVYTLDLSTIFEDVDGDTLNYKVAINGSPAVVADEQYTITPNTAGEYTLVFTANDGKEDSSDTYTVTLTVRVASDTYKTTGAYLRNTVTNPKIGTAGGEWTVIGLTRSEYNVGANYYGTYIANVLHEVQEKNGVLHDLKYTEYSRVVLGLTAVGYDVTNVAGYNLLQPLADYDKVVWQGINGPIWALLAFDSHNYGIPSAPTGVTQTTRENLIQEILSKQLSGGGWALTGTKADPDITGMSIQALAPYYNTNSDVKTAIDNALVKISELQSATGGFGSWNVANSESCAQVIIALTALGIDPNEDTRFIKNGNTVIDALNEFYVDGGGFRHVANGSRDAMATEQAYCALAAYERLIEGKASIYDMNDVEIKEDYKVVVELINAIGTVNPGSGNVISGARLAYDALSDTQKAKVSNYSTLQAAEKKYKEIAQRIDHVKTLIDSIGQVTLGSETKIKDARSAYNKLSAEEQKYVANYATLTRAETKLAQLKKADHVIGLIDAIGAVTKNSEDVIRTARTAYDALSNEEKALVTNYATLTAAERVFASLNEEKPDDGGNKPTPTNPPEQEDNSNTSSGSGTPGGSTKSLGGGQTSKVTVDGKTYTVSKEAAAVIEKIKGLASGATYDLNAVVEAYKMYSALTNDQKAEVVNYADLEAQMNRIGVDHHLDETTGIKIEGVDWNIKLQVEEVAENSAVHQNTAGSIGSNTLVKMWNIKLIDILTDGEYQPAGTVTLRVPEPNLAAYDDVRIVYYNAQERKVEYLDCTVENGEVIWEVTHFSYYGVIGGAEEAQLMLSEESATPEQAATGVYQPVQQNSMMWVWVLIACVGAAAVVFILLIKTGKLRFKNR